MTGLASLGLVVIISAALTYQMLRLLGWTREGTK